MSFFKTFLEKKQILCWLSVFLFPALTMAQSTASHQIRIRIIQPVPVVFERARTEEMPAFSAGGQFSEESNTVLKWKPGNRNQKITVSPAMNSIGGDLKIGEYRHIHLNHEHRDVTETLEDMDVECRLTFDPEGPDETTTGLVWTVTDY